MSTGASIIGIGTSAYYKRGASWPKSLPHLGAEAIFAATVDAGIAVEQIDGFVYYAGGGMGVTGDAIETAMLMEILGIPEVTFSTGISGAGGGSAGAIGLAALGATSGEAKYIVVVYGLQQRTVRYGETFSAQPNTPQSSFHKPHGLTGPGQYMAMMAHRHMHLYGTRRDAFAEVAISTRHYATTQPNALQSKPLTKDQYFAARMISDPLCLFDFCLETDAAIACIVTTDDRAMDAKQRPARIVAAVHGGERAWGRGFNWGQQADPVYTSAGNVPIAKRLYERAGITANDIDVALLYDHFSPLVIMQLEDYGFCKHGEGGPFVESGALRIDGEIPTNTHGGNLSEVYAVGMTHVIEGVRQVRGTAANQVANAELALVTGGPAPLPVSGLILGAA